MHGSEAPRGCISHGLYSGLLAAAVGVSAAALYSFSLRLQPVEGDLTRFGLLSEGDYGFNLPQARMEEVPIDRGPAYERYRDIVILGDSFASMPRGGTWVDFLADRSGASVQVLDSESGLERLLSSAAFRAAPPKLVIFQCVERRLKDRAGALSSSCGPGGARGALGSAGSGPLPALPLLPRRGRMLAYARPLSKRPWQGDIRLARDYLAAGLMRRLGRGLQGVVEHRLSGPLFSSAKARSLIVFRDDETKLSWSEDDLGRIRCGLSAAQRAVQSDGRTLFLALILPDKLSAYSDFIEDPVARSRWAWRPPAVEGLNLVPAAQALRESLRAGTLDVYLPDDTHLGSAGAQAVAESVLRELERRGALSATDPRERGGA